MRRMIQLLAGSAILILSGCAKYEIPAPEYPDGIPENVSFSVNVQPIFDAKCVTCHGGAQAPDLSAGWSYDELIEGGYVITDEPLTSPIWLVFSGSHDGRATSEETLYILGWIIEGALDN